MSGTSFMDRLLDEVAVEWKKLGEVIISRRGKRLVKSQLEKVGRYAVYQNSKIPLGYYHESNAKADTTFVIVAGAAGEIGYSDVDFWAADDVYFFSAVVAINSKYLFHFLLTKRHEILSQVRRASIPRLSIDALEKLEIPIPCQEYPEKSLAIQAEIVRILDAFSEPAAKLTAKLTAELTARKKQYNYYRDQLLSFEEKEVEWKTLGEVALEFGRGKSKHRPRNDARLYGGNIPFIQTGDIRNASHIITAYTQTYSDFGLKQSKLWPKGTLCITIAANIAETSILGFDSCFPDSVIGFIADPEKTSSSYVEYLLSSLKSKLQAKSTGSAQDNLNLATFENLRLPFPPLAEQEGIVSVLRKFEDLINSISEGLSREIELRQKQYEYYRDLLFTFPKTQRGRGLK
jgi:type I restriction enzyme S subunit